MTPGEAWLRYHCLRRWADRIAAAGPDMSLSNFVRRERILYAHRERLAGLQAQLRELRDEADRLTLERGGLA